MSSGHTPALRMVAVPSSGYARTEKLPIIKQAIAAYFYGIRPDERRRLAINIQQMLQRRRAASHRPDRSKVVPGSSVPAIVRRWQDYDRLTSKRQYLAPLSPIVTADDPRSGPLAAATTERNVSGTDGRDWDEIRPVSRISMPHTNSAISMQMAIGRDEFR